MPLLESIGQIAINVNDLPRAVNFYRDVLGITHLFDAGPNMSFFQCGSVRIMLAVAEKPEYDHPASILYYKVSDIHATHQELRAKNVLFDQAPQLLAPMPDHDLWMAFFRDSENNLLALMSEVKRTT
jgi:methylmalonyl-CoA/ethylmalonyl-CoA epimerase